jgi:hypothetical protein
MLSLILWLPFVEFFGGSFGGRHMGRGIIIDFYIVFFFLCIIYTRNKIRILSFLSKVCKIW